MISNLSAIILDNLLLAHAASGCDTVSALSGIGKTKLVKLLAMGTFGSGFPVFYEEFNKVQLRFIGMKLIYTSDSKHSAIEKHRIL